MRQDGCARRCVSAAIAIGGEKLASNVSCADRAKNEAHPERSDRSCVK